MRLTRASVFYASPRLPKSKGQRVIFSSEKIWLAIFIALLGSIFFVQQSFAVGATSLKLEWQSSDDDTVTGYAVYYGIAGTPMTNRLDVGLSTSVIFSDLTAGTDYSFFVVAYDFDLNESEPSNFLTYTAQAISDLQLTQSTEGAMIISFNVPPNAACHVEYSDTLTPPNWQPLTAATGDSDGLVTVADLFPAPGGCRFYRAAVDLPDVDNDLYSPVQDYVPVADEDSYIP
jgi:hypothetical protein